MMAAPAPRPLTRFARFSRLWLLPPSGYGNGPDDDAWAPVLDTSERIVVPHMLSTFRAAQVPACATPLRTPGTLRDDYWRPEDYRLRAKTSRLSRSASGD